MSIIEKLEYLHCDDDDDASTCVDHVSAFFDYTKALAKESKVRLSEVYHAMSTCEPCMIEESEENCAVKPYPTSLPDLNCGVMKTHLYGTAFIAEGFDISATDAYNAFSTCAECIGGDDSKCSTQYTGEEVIIDCADIRDHFMCELMFHSYKDEGCEESSSESCRSLQEKIEALKC